MEGGGLCFVLLLGFHTFCCTNVWLAPRFHVAHPNLQNSQRQSGHAYVVDGDDSWSTSHGLTSRERAVVTIRGELNFEIASRQLINPGSGNVFRHLHALPFGSALPRHPLRAVRGARWSVMR